MITIDNIDMSGFNRGVAGFINRLGIEAPRVVRHESGELIKTLVRVTPPKDVAKSGRVAGEKVQAKFEAAETHQDLKSFRHEIPTAGVVWYSWSHNFLYGVDSQMDMRQADTDTLYRKSLQLTMGGRQNLPFIHRRGRQRVMLSQKILTTPDQRASVVKKVKSHFGRLKAGWIVAWGAGVVKMTGTLPKYVTQHLSGARGRYIDGLANKENPTFTIGNSAKGITDRKVTGFVQFASNLRAKAMATNLHLYLKGKKWIGDYARGE